MSPEGALVPILIPAYNAAEWLHQCLDSVMAQTYPHLQIVVVDDGSTDKTALIAEEYAGRDNRIEIHSKANGGVASARNELLRRAKGDWLLFVDADDWIEPNMVQVLLDLALSYKSNIVCCGMVCNNDPIERKNIVVTQWDKSRLIREFVRHEKISGSLWNKLINCDLIIENPSKNYSAEVPLFDERVCYGEDALWVWQLLKRLSKDDTITLTDRPLYHYRRNSASISHTFSEKRYSENIVWENISKDVENEFPSLVNDVHARRDLQKFWQLHNAARAGLPQDERIKNNRKAVLRSLPNILRSGLMRPHWLFFALAITLNYRLGKRILG